MLACDFGQKFDFFFIFSFKQNKLNKCFIIVWIKSKPLQTLKILILHSHQTGFFPKGLVHNLRQKLNFIFYFSFLDKASIEKMFGDIFY